MDAFLKELQRFKAANVFNPWRQVDSRFDLPYSGPSHRRSNLRQHLDCDARYILIGEAPGYQGCRFSGIPFTSERLMVEDEIPRIGTSKMTTKPDCFTEPSATTVWRVLRDLGIQNQTVLWNAFPFHPHQPDKPYSNRAPTKDEIEAARSEWYINYLTRQFRKAHIIAVGKTAQRLLEGMGIECDAVRHPSMGGVRQFEDGLRTLVNFWLRMKG